MTDSRGNNGAGVLDTVSAPSHSQDWTLDALGNWSSLSTDGTAQSRTHNSQNQITSIQTQTTPTYDANGDTTTDNAGQQYTFDAWNHIHAVKNAGGTTLVTYSYDAIYRRIKEAPASGATTDLYYSASWQVLEERLSTHPSAPSTQLVWSPVYVDCMVLRDRDTNADGTLDERLYCLQDANYNVTSTLSTAGAIQERYRYDPYGAVTYLDSSFSSHASAYAWQYLHQGGRLDLVSGLYCFRNRDLHPTLGRWMQEDPLGYVDGLNRFLAYRIAPSTRRDPRGLWGAGGADDQLRRMLAELERRYWERGNPLLPPLMYEYQLARNALIRRLGHDLCSLRGHADFPGGDVFDYNLEDTDPNTEPIRHCDRHFRDLPRSEADVGGAISGCDADSFQRAMHRGQDYFSHFRAGYRCPCGHLFGPGADDPCTHGQAYQDAFAWSQRMLDRWNASCTRGADGNWYRIPIWWV